MRIPVIQPMGPSEAYQTSWMESLPRHHDFPPEGRWGHG